MNKYMKIGQSKKLYFKFIIASFFISAIAVTLGFFGTNLILNSQEKRMQNRFVPEALRTIQYIQQKTQAPIEEVVSDFNELLETNQRERGPGPGPGRPPMKIVVVTRENSKFEFPEPVGTFKIIPNHTAALNIFNDQIYNYDGIHFLVFQIGHGGPRGGMNNRPRPDHGPGGFHFGPPPRQEGPGGPGGPPFFLLPLLLTFVIILFVITSSALLVLYFLKRQAKKAGNVLQALKQGDLKARFPITKIDEASELMLEFNQMAEEIEKLVGDLRDTDNLRRKLLQELAHDLRTPVASMKSLLESLLYQGDRMSKELREENLQLSIKEVDYFHHLVEDLLFLSGVHDIRYRGKFSTVDVSDVIQHEVQVLNETNKDIKVNLAFEEFYFIKADQHLFQRLMKNALSNAIGNAAQIVSVKIEKVENHIMIEISNDGNGLSAEDIETFGKKRATRRINENVEGRISVGLGAVIMAKICEIHSVQMSIKNNGNDGKSGATLQLKFAALDV